MAKDTGKIDWAALLAELAKLLAALFGTPTPTPTPAQLKAHLKSKGCPDAMCDCACQNLEAAQHALLAAKLSLECAQACGGSGNEVAQP